MKDLILTEGCCSENIWKFHLILFPMRFVFLLLLFVKFKQTFFKKFSKHSFSKKPTAKSVPAIVIHNMWHFSPCINSASKIPKQLYAEQQVPHFYTVCDTIYMFIPQSVYVVILKAEEQTTRESSFCIFKFHSLLSECIKLPRHAGWRTQFPK